MSRDLSSFGLEDQIAIVTGASQGIGQTLAIALARAGADVARFGGETPPRSAQPTLST